MTTPNETFRAVKLAGKTDEEIVADLVALYEHLTGRQPSEADAEKARKTLARIRSRGEEDGSP